MRTTRSLLCLLATLTCGLLACGGSSGPSGPGLLLSGPYHLVGVSAEMDGGPRVTTLWGTLSADGAGMLALTSWTNGNNDFDGPDTETGIPYTVGSDRTVTVRDAAEPSLVVAEGRVTAAGDVAVLASSADGREPGFWVAVRRRGVFSTASLNGWYHACLFWYRSSQKESTGYSGRFQFDGVGGFTGTGLSNVEGVPGNFSLKGTYTLDSDGSAAFNIATWNLRGGVLEDGRLAVLAGSTSNGAPPVLLILIRATSVTEDWDVAYDEHLIAGLERDWVGTRFRSYGGGFRIDDNINITVAWSRNEEGTNMPLAPWTGTWASDPDASFGFTDAAGANYTGGLEQTGRYCVIGGGRNVGSNPALFFFVR